MSEADWLLMLNGEGTVTAVDGGPPASWIQRRLDDCAGLPDHVRAAARTFVRELARPEAASTVRRVRVAAPDPASPSFTLLAVEAIPLRPIEVSLGALIRRALVPLAAQAASAEVSLRVESAADLPARLSLDGEKIAWAATVLVGNALRHVRRGSQVLPGGHVGVRLGHNAAQRMVSLSVEDDGSGIAPSVQRWLFQENPETGVAAGVALRLVHEVVVAHGGGMVVKSSTEPGDRGTTVTLWIPVRT